MGAGRNRMKPTSTQPLLNTPAQLMYALRWTAAVERSPRPRRLELPLSSDANAVAHERADGLVLTELGGESVAASDAVITVEFDNNKEDYLDVKPLIKMLNRCRGEIVSPKMNQKTSWPELVGKLATLAATQISKDRPDVAVEVLPPGAPLTSRRISTTSASASS
ncbi:hypothetical protein E2562_028705 [Oryza meyeriana var. granulata]|uniref:Uncharacterized protein n=1 Tax=Oryza meyeriana var. granulata TaxID=110450 RepID=A0A6G1CKD6_9ORYZ|nr:hypothetical protein E2562_028705 [Oryza meyeriana var. granulata]